MCLPRFCKPAGISMALFSSFSSMSCSEEKDYTHSVFFCGSGLIESGSSISSEPGSESRTRVDDQKLKNGRPSYPGETFSPQNRTSITWEKMLTNFFLFLLVFLPSWIRIRGPYWIMIQSGSGSTTLMNTIFIWIHQCSGSMTFWCGSGSADPCLWLMDPDQD